MIDLEKLKERLCEAGYAGNIAAYAEHLEKENEALKDRINVLEQHIGYELELDKY